MATIVYINNADEESAASPLLLRLKNTFENTQDELIICNTNNHCPHTNERAPHAVKSVFIESNGIEDKNAIKLTIKTLSSNFNIGPIFLFGHDEDLYKFSQSNGTLALQPPEIGKAISTVESFTGPL